VNRAALRTTDHRSDRWGGGVIIYAVGDNGTGLIKLGKTRNMAKRFQQHADQGPNPALDLEFLAGVVGADSDETAVLNYFKAHRSTISRATEWFDPVPPLVDWLRWLRDQGHVALTVDECSEHFLDRVESGAWLPNTDRTKPPVDGSLFPPNRWNLGAPEITGDDFYTPAPLIDAARRTMGTIDLDAASHPIAQRVVRASTFFTIHDNALVKDWQGNVWCNPPYGQWAPWAAKIARELDAGRVRSLILLGPTRSLTVNSLISLLRRCDAFGVTQGRMKFWGEKAATPDDGHFLMYFGDDPERFRSQFAPHLSFPAQRHAIEELSNV